MTGKAVTRFELLECLSCGRMGVAYKARDLKLDRPVALNRLIPETTRDSGAKQAFVHEAKAAPVFHHNIIGVANIMYFGLAKLTGRARLTQTGSTIGTATNMFPRTRWRGECGSPDGYLVAGIDLVRTADRWSAFSPRTQSGAAAYSIQSFAAMKSRSIE